MKERMKSESVILLHQHIGNLSINVWFGAVEDLGVELLLGTSFIDEHVQGVFPEEYMLVAWYSRFVNTLMQTSE